MLQNLKSGLFQRTYELLLGTTLLALIFLLCVWLVGSAGILLYETLWSYQDWLILPWTGDTLSGIGVNS